MDRYLELVDMLVEAGDLKTPRIVKAFRKVHRKGFVLPEHRHLVHVNAPLPIPAGQTISQPYTVAFMLELLQPRAGQKVLDIGFGSGWQTCILSEIVGSKGVVYAAEVVPEVEAFGRRNVEKYGAKNVRLFLTDASKGLPEQAPYDRIIAAAAAPGVQEELKRQLKVGGRLVMPVGRFLQAIVLITRKSKTKFEQREFPGFAFVPMRGEA